MQFQDALLAEHARYIHKTVPTAAFGGLIIVGIIVVVFRKVVPMSYMYLWLASFVVLTAIRMIIWARYRRQEFDPTVARAWLRQAVGAAAISGALWGCGSLFMFPPGQLQYQFTFMFALEMMAVAAMFSYSAHFPTFLAFFLPSMPPGIIGLALQEHGSSQQLGFAIGILLLSIVIIGSVRFFNRMILDTIRLRFENVGLVAQLTVQKDAAESANVAKTRFLAAASHDLRQPIPAEPVSRGVRASRAAASGDRVARQSAPVRADHGRDVPFAPRCVEARCGRDSGADLRVSARPAASSWDAGGTDALFASASTTPASASRSRSKR